MASKTPILTPSSGGALVHATNPEGLAIQAWLLSLRSPNTRAAYAADIEMFHHWVTQRGGTISAATPTAVEAWINERLTIESPSTVERRRASLSSFYGHAAKPGRVLHGRINPASTQMIQRVETSSIPAAALTTEEMVNLITAAKHSPHPTRDTLLVLILGTGLRVSELCALSVSDVASVSGHWVLNVLGKGRKVRRVPMPPQVAPLFDLDREPSTPLVLDNDGGRLSRHQVTRILARLQRQAQIGTKITPHVLRASCVTELLAQGAPLWAVQDLVGHADPRTTRSYQQRNQALAEGAAMVATMAARLGA